MKKEEWNEGLNHLDSDLVEEYVRKKEQLTNIHIEWICVPDSAWGEQKSLVFWALHGIFTVTGVFL